MADRRRRRAHSLLAIWMVCGLVWVGWWLGSQRAPDPWDCDRVAAGQVCPAR